MPVVVWLLGVLIPLAGNCSEILSPRGAQGGSVSLTYSLTAEAVTLHEPVLFEFLIENKSRDVARVNMGWNRMAAFTFDVVRPAGPRTVARPAPIDGGSLTPDFEVDAGGTYRQRAALNHWIQFERPGVYRIDVQSAAALTVGRGVRIDAPERRTFTVVVHSLDVVRLRARCDQLVDLAGRRGAEGGEAADHLSVIRHVGAVPCHERALMKGILSRYSLLETLVAIGGPEARQALQNLASSAPYPWIARDARAALARVK
jgi:hypothetical protein